MRSPGWEEVTVVRNRVDCAERRGCGSWELSTAQGHACLPSSREPVLCQAVADTEPRERGPGVWPPPSSKGAPRGVLKVVFGPSVLSGVSEFK